MASGFPDKRSRLVDGTERRQLVHHVGAPADGGEREAPADDLAEHREVGRDAVACPGRPPSPTRNPVITSSNTSSAPARVQRSRSRSRKPALGRNQTHVGGDRLHDHRREVGAERVERVLERGVVVERHHDGVGDGRRR